MPTFTSRRPTSIAESFASMLGGNPGVSAKDILDAEKSIAQVEHSRASGKHQLSLAEKARAEIEAMREQQRFQRDPNAAIEYGARSANVPLNDARRLESNFRGEVLQPLTPNDDSGEANPAAPIQAPDSVSPQQRNVYQAAVASVLANRLATGKTNAAQMTQAGGNILTDRFRSELAKPNLPVADRTALIEAVSEKPVMPFRQNAAGTSVVDQMGGGATTPNTITAQAGNALTAARTGAERALAGQRGSAADVNRARVPLINAQTDRTRNPAAKTFKPIDPVQAEKRISDMTTKEYESLPRAERKTTTLEQYRNRRRAEIMASTGGNIAGEIDEARAAIAKGADPAKVKARFRQRTKADLPDDDDD